MAETDADRRAAGAMTEEEADRLSEQFRPSWEEDPPTVPRDQPVPAPPSAPRSQPVPGPAVTTAPVVSVTSAPVVAVTSDKPQTLVAARAVVPLTVTAPRKPTLVGTAPAPAAAPDSSNTDTPAADDEEPPTEKRPEPEATVQIEVEELPPESKPSGIGQKYKPKDEGAPAVVLGADVQATESGARLTLEAEHRSRRAPTIVRMNAFDLPSAPAHVPEPEFAVPRKRSFGMVVALGLLVLGGGVAVALAVAHGGSTTPAQAPAASATVWATVAPDTAAPAPPPAAPAAEPAPSLSASAPAEPTATSSATVTPVSPSVVATEAHAPEAKPAARPAKTSKTAKSASTKTAAPKPASPASKAAAPRTGGKNTIVRETPF